MNKYMVVEKFKDGCYEEVYRRFGKHGRMLPEGLYYLNSWVSRADNLCFQLMETGNPQLFNQWTDRWSDLTDFEIYPVT